MGNLAKVKAVAGSRRVSVSVAGSTAGAKISIPESIAARNTKLPTADTARVKKAVFAHIQAVRALGRTQVNTTEIAKALGLRIGLVDQAVRDLESKGVKVAE